MYKSFLMIIVTLLIMAGGSSFANEYPALNGVQVFVLDKKNMTVISIRSLTD